MKGTLPGNPIIQMGMDPMCAKLNAGKRPVQEIVSAAADGSLANVFVSLQGTFPADASALGAGGDRSKCLPLRTAEWSAHA